MNQRFFSPAETARRLKVSTKALRLYEMLGLVRPVRTSAGWRTYGPDQMVRLHQVLALKHLGVPLRRVGELLGDQLAGSSTLSWSSRRRRYASGWRATLDGWSCW